MDFICTKDTESVSQFIAKQPELGREREGEEGKEGEGRRVGFQTSTQLYMYVYIYLQSCGFRIENIIFSNHHHKCINISPQFLTLLITSLEESGEREEEGVNNGEERRYI